jgi:hypothetical protein
MNNKKGMTDVVIPFLISIGPAHENRKCRP